MHFLIRSLMSAGASALHASVAVACSTVALGLPEPPLVAYSYDVSMTGAGFVVINPQGVTRRSIMEGEVAEWTASHGSLTFNQFGPGMPTAGMNTAGLAVTLMWNDEVVYPAMETAPIVNELEFIQYLLDTAGSVDEALVAVRGVHIDGIVPIHFFLADAEGDVAVLQPTEAGFLIHQDGAMPVPALTNTSYAEGLARFPDAPPPEVAEDPGSLQRFAIAAKAAQQPGPVDLTAAFEVLDRVANTQTRWQIVFDPDRQHVTFRLHGHVETHEVSLNALDFQCRDVPQVFDIQSTATGEDISFAPLDPAELRDLLREVLSGFQATAAMGDAAADGMAMGLLASARCGG